MTAITVGPRFPALAHIPKAPVRAAAARAILRTSVSQLPVRVTFPDGTVWGAGGSGSPELRVVRPQALFARLGTDTKIGLGEAYMAGEWTTGPGSDLGDLLTPFASRLTRLVPEWLQRFRRFVDENLPEQQRNTTAGSRNNIEAHYDLSNHLFENFLDPTMSYSAASFERSDESLETAQERKMERILDAARVGEDSRVLEIGTGWGALAIRAARRGAQVTTITLSHEQAQLARQRIEEAELSDRIEVRIQDYREVDGSYDAIVSVEMIEAVGEEYWPTYFRTLDARLAPGGRVAIQAILMPHQRMLATRRSFGWIQKYVFPGGLIPSVEAIEQVTGQQTRLRLVTQHSLQPDYARTLRLWRERFTTNWDTIRTDGFDETFRRMWEFYLAYSEAGFASGYLDVRQLTFTR
ncbi:SAM-dependent methyltransferase [Aeromicrobium piscarium]|uniref:Class I SAM-dependent methyltransferase n=1 Tax=Aeromicrobium piscarium TaxID=2590901 RepID=A0A554S910_9ACTN|nr:cyclopropane-fatty-acyl-phospholipid synthase family protein [Aeromicrobium piscarium]TSD62830.1 class I SAM-dependent methyltransferase [Aeromicrobium piscarium]